ncbi:polysaccharide biosynthesis C-terminal domain-containing protein [Candidatus Sumerlaeota bacterium]|nr:polysaccharide biosynthesis C-terminal domain-containing protein [Candidatus Sumerlaeota bacterium]
MQQTGSVATRSGSMRGILIELLGYAPARLVPALASFISVVVFTRLLSPTEYGRYSLLATGGTLTALVLFAWVQHSILRYYRQWHQTGQLRVLYGTVNLLLICLTAGIFLMGIILGLLFATLISPEWLFLLVLTALFALGRGLYNVALKLAQADHRAIRFATYSVSYAVGGLLVGILLIRAGLQGSAAILLGSGIIGILVGALEFGPNMKVSKISFSNDLAQKFFRYGFPLMGVAAFAIVLDSGDRYVIAWFNGESDVAVYSAIYSVSSQLIGIAIRIIMLVAFPIIVDKWSGDNPDSAEIAASRFLYVYLLVTVPIVFGLTTVRRSFITLLFPASYGHAMYLLPWIVGGAFLQGLSEYFGIPLQLYERTDTLFKLLLFSGLFNICLNLILVPSVGPIGAAYATFISYLLYAFLLWRYSSRHESWKWRLMTSRITVPFVASGLMWFVVSHILPSLQSVEMDLLFKIMISVFVYMVSLIALREPTSLRLLRLACTRLSSGLGFNK